MPVAQQEGEVVLLVVSVCSKGEARGFDGGVCWTCLVSIRNQRSVASSSS